MELANAGHKDVSFFQKRIEYCREFCSLFPETDDLTIKNMGRAEAESYFAIGEIEKGEEAFEKILKEYPDWAWGYVGWGDMYCQMRINEDVPLDYEKAEKIYRMALDKEVDEEEVILDRLEDLKEEKNKLKLSGLKIGNSVVVKPGILCPDYEGLEIGGWQGTISEISEDEEGNVLICIQWDSVTLKNMPGFYIDQSGEEGLDYALMYLRPDEVKLTKPRDSEADVVDTLKEISKSHSWNYLCEEGKWIQKILANVNQDDEGAALECWKKHLETVLSFPFEAEISEYQEKGPLLTGDKVMVNKISLATEPYGIIVAIIYEGKKYDFPLCDLRVIDKKSPNHQLVNDYCVWFANR